MLNSRFTFLCTEIDRDILERLAGRYKRSKSDTIRIILWEKAAELKIAPKPENRFGQLPPKVDLQDD